MNLTGKDLYETARPYLEGLGLECSDWEEGQFGQGTLEFYNELAKRLNTQFIIPLQGDAQACLEDEKATLLDAVTVISDLQAQNTKLATEVRVLRESDRALFDAQEAMIDALKALVKEMEETLVYCRENSFPGEKVTELQERAKVLLVGEEH